MYRIYSTGIETAAASAILIPILFLYHIFIFHNIKKTAAFFQPPPYTNLINLIPVVFTAFCRFTELLNNRPLTVSYLQEDLQFPQNHPREVQLQNRLTAYR